jgi:hypothetical protein
MQSGSTSTGAEGPALTVAVAVNVDGLGPTTKSNAARSAIMDNSKA